MLEFNFTPFPVLETERLLLRQTTEADLDFLFKLRSDKEVMKYIDRPLAKNKDDILQMYQQMCKGVAENEAIAWHIDTKEDRMPAGQIGFYRNDKVNHRGEVGYMISPELAGKGLATEAIKEVLRFGFEVLKFHSIEGNINPGNGASGRVLEKQGFVKEAHFRENYHFDGKFLDSVIYSLLASDWRKAAAKEPQ